MPGDGTIHVVRHAHALDRASFDGDDASRPLSQKGRRQAEALAKRLSRSGAKRLWSSPALRCCETLEPLSARSGVVLEASAALAEGRPGSQALEHLVDAIGSGDHDVLVACTHGDVLDGMLVSLAELGIDLGGPPSAAKAEVFALEILSGMPVHVERSAPPSG